jgi:AcrR family transcriptional regulator
MVEAEIIDRRSTIIDAAFKVFLNYGFRRTTMADIADASGISRPALYLEFKNKADIYRAGFLVMLARTFRNVDQALEGEGPLLDRLIAALNAGIVAPMRKLQQSPHGAELFEVKKEIAGDLGQDWNAVLEGSLQRALADAFAKGQIDLESHSLSAADLARLIVSSAEGIKKCMTDWHQAEADISRIVELMVRPLVRKRP